MLKRSLTFAIGLPPAVPASLVAALVVATTAVATMAVAAFPAAATAQISEADRYSSRSDFDFSRAILYDSTVNKPFWVEESTPMRQLLADGVIHEGTLLLVMEKADKKLGLLTGQMAYHHLAQGEIDGEPWMVSF